jgi:hypothetical protein
LIKKPEFEAKVACNFVLDRQVFLEFKIIFNDFVPTALQLMNERTGTLGFIGFTLGVSQKVGTVLTRAE